MTIRLPALLLAAVSIVSGCTSSRPPEPVGAYSVSRDADGSLRVQVGEDVNAETLMAAVQAAATLAAWEAPERADGLELQGSDYRGPGVGIIYDYGWDVPGARFQAFVYSLPDDAPAQFQGTLDALGVLQTRGTIGSFGVAQALQTRRIPWGDGDAALHHAVLRETTSGTAYRSYFYLVEAGKHWVKVRATAPEAEVDDEAVDALVLGLLAQD